MLAAVVLVASRRHYAPSSPRSKDDAVVLITRDESAYPDIHARLRLPFLASLLNGAARDTYAGASFFPIGEGYWKISA